MIFVDTISIHASAKEATVNERYQRGNTGFQSTPPRRRRPDFSLTIKKVDSISIHASAKEATLYIPVMCGSLSISIHASAKEATNQL